MSITGHFDADFEKFKTAVDSAVIKLKSFESGAGKVESQLNKMADQFSGRRLISEATLMATAVDKLGGVSTLTEAELTRLGAKATEAAEKMKKLGMEVPESITKITKAYSDLQEQQAKKPPEPPTPPKGFFADISTEITKTAAGFISAEAAISGFTKAYSALTAFVGQSVQSFLSAEAAQNKLVAALKAQSMAAPETVAQYTALAGTFQATTKFSDDLITEMEALLVQVGDIMPSKMESALQAATDLAQGLGVDLQTATMLVAKAAAGHTETLGKYGIAVNEAKLKTQGFDAVLEAINSKFGGQAQAALDTTSGKLEKLANDWDNVKEAIGKAILGNPIAQRAMKELGDAASEAGQKADGSIGSVSGLVRAFGKPIEADAILALEMYVDLLNSADAAIARILAKPSPFKQAAAERTLPAIDQEQLKQFDKDAEAAGRSVKAYEKYLLETAGATDQWKDTLKAMDAELVESIKWSLKAGASQQTLADLHTLSAGQIKAVAQALREEEQQQQINIATYERRIGLMQAGLNLTSLGAGAQIAALQQLDNAEYELTRAVYAQTDSETARMKLIEDYTKRHLELQNQIMAKERELAAVVNDQIVKELEARQRVMAARGLTVGGEVKAEKTPLEQYQESAAAIMKEVTDAGLDASAAMYRLQEASDKFVLASGGYIQTWGTTIAGANSATQSFGSTMQRMVGTTQALGAAMESTLQYISGGPGKPNEPTIGLIGKGPAANPIEYPGGMFGPNVGVFGHSPQAPFAGTNVNVKIEGIIDNRMIDDLGRRIGTGYLNNGRQVPNLR